MRVSKKRERFCLNCGSPIKNRRANKFCDIECRRMKNETDKIKSMQTRECDGCGKDYALTRKDKKYCSVECRSNSVYKNGRFFFFSRDNFKCIYCGKSSIEDGVKLNIDHIVPITRGGENTNSNTVTACEECNISKSNKKLDYNDEMRVKLIVDKRNSNLSIKDVEKIKEILKIHEYRHNKGND